MHWLLTVIREAKSTLELFVLTLPMKNRSEEDMVKLAIYLLRQGIPLPLDLQTNLIHVGVDVATLERKYG